MNNTTTDLFDNLGLKINTKGCDPRIKVEIGGDQNDGDYTSATTFFNLHKPDEVQLLTELMTIVRTQANGECMVEMMENPPEECASHCKECPCYNHDYLDDREFVQALRRLVRLPMGPCGVCHTLTYMSVSYIDENGVEYELVNKNNSDCDWGFPISP